MSGRRELVRRYGHNPILTKHDVPYVVETVHNAAVIKASGRYYITYSAYSRHGVRIGLAVTDDFDGVARVAMITEADHRNVVLFPERFGGRFARLDRPHSHIG